MPRRERDSHDHQRPSSIFAALDRVYRAALARKSGSCHYLSQGQSHAEYQNTTGGLSARVFRNGCWGFASSPRTSDLQAVIAAATQNATFLDARENKGLAPFAPDSPVASKSFGTTKPRLSQKQIMDFIREIDAYIAQRYPALSSRTISLNCLDMEKTLITSDGASLYSLLPRSNFRVSMAMDKGGGVVEVFKSAGGLGRSRITLLPPKTCLLSSMSSTSILLRKAKGSMPLPDGKSVC